jgi:hypothetical protein
MAAILTSVHYYVDLIALIAAVLALIPIYKDYGTKYFVGAMVVLVVCVLGLSAAIAEMHRHELTKIESHIRVSLKNGQRKSLDDLAHDLNFKEVGQLDEALDAMMNDSNSEIQSEEVSLKNCDGSMLALVRRYYLGAESRNQ